MLNALSLHVYFHAGLLYEFIPKMINALKFLNIDMNKKLCECTVRQNISVHVNYSEQLV